MRCLAILALLSVMQLSGQSANASFILASGSLTQSIAEAFVYDYATSLQNPHSLFIDTYSVPASANSRDFNETAEVVARGYNLRSSASSNFTFTPTQQTLVSAIASGSSFSNIENGEVGTYGATQSVFITNLKFSIDSPVLVSWQYAASGAPGEFGTSDGLDMRIKIREFSDNSYSVSAITRTVTNQFFGAGNSFQAFSLTPGYYDLVTQGRVLFNQPNVTNRDGDSEWSYKYTITNATVPEPSSLLMFGIGTYMLSNLRFRRRNNF